MLTLYQYLDEKLGRDLTTPEKAVTAYRHRIALFEALFDGENVRNRSWAYAYFHHYLAEALFRCGETEEGFEMLEKAVAYYEEWFSIPVGTELADTGIFDRHTQVKRGYITPETVLRSFENDRRPEGFVLASEDERYRILTARIRKYISE